MKAAKYKLTLTCEADTAEDLVKAFDLKKKDFDALLNSVSAIEGSREAMGPYPDFTLGGKAGGLKYTLVSLGQKGYDVPAFPNTCGSVVVRATETHMFQLGNAEPYVVPPKASDDQPEGCQADGTGGGCGGGGKCDSTGVCATKGKADD